MPLPTEPPQHIAPAPWTLNGKGYVLLYRFPKAWVQRYGFLAEYQRDTFKLGIGAVMLVDYETSGVGPYRELLFIPGLFKLGGHWTYSISKIYVSSYDSVWNGIENWGIPKELADFDWKTQGDYEHVRVSHQGRSFFEATLRPSAKRWPINTRFFPLRVTQHLRSDSIFTQPTAQGKGGLARAVTVHAEAADFPPLGQLKPLMVLSVQDFQMVFPVPTMTPLS